MPLTAAEQAELKQLQGSLGMPAGGGNAGGLSPAEQAELNALEKQFGKRPQPGLSPAEQAEMQLLEKQLAPGGTPTPSAVAVPAPPPSPGTATPPATGTPPVAGGPTPQEKLGLFQQILSQITELTGLGGATEQEKLLAKNSAGESEAFKLGTMAKGMIDQAGGVEGIKSTAGDIAGSTAGEIAGRATGIAVAPFLGPAAPVGPIVGGAVGAAGGLYASRKAQGKEVSAGELGMEAFYSLLPDAVLKPLAAGMRKTAARTAKGLQATKDVAAEWLLRHGPDAFQPKEKKVLDVAYDVIRGSGAAVDPSNVMKKLEGIGPKRWKRLETEMLRFSDGPKHQFPNAGENAIALLKKVKDGEKLAGVDLGYLTHLRSEARKGAMKGRDPKVQDSLDLLAESIDDVINRGEFTQGEHMRPFLAKTQKEYAKYMDSQDLEEFLWRGGVVGRDPSHTHYTLDLGKMATSLREPGQSKVAQAAQRALLKPGNEKALAQIEEFSRRMSGFDVGLKSAKEGGRAFKKTGGYVVNIDPGMLAKADSGGIGSLILGSLSTVLAAGPASRERFMRIVANKRGKLALEDLTVLANLMRREAMKDTQEEQAPTR